MKIKEIKDIVEASQKIIELLVRDKKLVDFALMVDHADGTVSNAAFSPATLVAPGQKFVAVEDFEKLLLLLMTHPRIKELEYDEKRKTIFAMFSAPEMQQIWELENPSEGEP